MHSVVVTKRKYCRCFSKFSYEWSSPFYLSYTIPGYRSSAISCLTHIRFKKKNASKKKFLILLFTPRDSGRPDKTPVRKADVKRGQGRMVFLTPE
jgi:hypothetical protein